MAGSEHLTLEEVKKLVNHRNREKRQEVPQPADADDKPLPEPEEVQDIDDKEPLKLSNLKEGVEIIYQEGKEKVTFVVNRFIGSGGYAKTYLVNQKLMEHMNPMILKEFCPRDAALRDRENHLLFDREAKNIKSALEDFKKEPQRINKLLEQTPQEIWESLNLVISHTGKTFTCFGNEYYVMECVPGKPLTELMKESGETILPEEKLDILMELCKAVHNLHGIGCVHQDLSSNNVLVSKDEYGSIKLKVIDFGMCTTLGYREWQGYSGARIGGTRGFWDYPNLATYKFWSDSHEDKLRERLKLIDIYSLGAVLAYVYLFPSEFYSKSEDSCFTALDKFIIADRCGEEQKVLKEEAPADEKAKILYNMVWELAVAATHPNVDERIQTVDEFMERLQAIKNYLNPPSKGSEELEAELEEQQRLREEEEEGHRREMEARIKEIEGQQSELKNLKDSLKAKDEAGRKEVQELQDRLQKEQTRLKQELQQKEQAREAEKKRREEVQVKYEEEKKQAKGKEQELVQKIKFLIKQLEEEKCLRLEQDAKYEEERKKNAEEMQRLRGAIKNITSNPPISPVPPTPWYKRYKLSLLIVLVVLGMAGVAAGVGSIDWNSDATQLKDSDTELQEQSVEDVSSSVQSAEADINVSQQLQPEQLTALIQRARKNERTRRYLEEELCDREVIVLEEKEGVPVRIPTLQLFNELSDNYPIVGITHKVAELHYENGKIKLITLIKIKQQ